MRARAALPLLLLACTRNSPEPCQDHLPPWPAAVIEDPSLDEISGLAASVRNPGILWAIEDSGADAVIHALKTDGTTAGSLRLEDTTNVDWEDLAVGPCANTTCIYVGEIGDNLAQRDDAAVLRVEEPLLEELTDVPVRADRFSFRYPSGAQDAEALIVTPEGRAAILTKRNDGTSRLFIFPRMTPGAATELDEVAAVPTSVNVKGLPSAVTAADLWPDGSRLLVRTYLGVWEFKLRADDLSDVGARDRQPAPVPPELQGEAIAYDVHEGGFWTVSEGVRPVLHRVSCRR